jgi:hypothetical protein
MGVACTKCLQGRTDANNNGIPDTEDIYRLIETYRKREKAKKDQKLLGNVLKHRRTLL